jgi:hypothetical protein
MLSPANTDIILTWEENTNTGETGKTGGCHQGNQ